MFKLLNQFSFLFLLVPIVTLVLIYLLRGKGSRPKQVLAVLLLTTITTSFFLLRPGTNRVTGEDTADSLVSSSTPTLLEIYSDF